MTDELSRHPLDLHSECRVRSREYMLRCYSSERYILFSGACLDHIARQAAGVIVRARYLHSMQLRVPFRIFLMLEPVGDAADNSDI